MKNKTFTRETSKHSLYFLVVFTLLFVLSCVAMLKGDKVPSEAINASITLVQPPEAHIEGTKVMISCYTGYESHGLNGREDGVSVATHLYPQGTWIHIDGIGDRRVDTITADRYADRIDLWMGPDYEDWLECIEFGLQMREVTIINQ